jgi:NADPH-dependent glutamate synthase beta subunit-like oxidoreductase
VDKPVSIATLKAFAADYDLFDPREETYMPDIQEKSGKKIAIVGAGPAGLSAAYFLAKNGHEVKVYEAMDKPGGMMRYGIPQYRLPKHIIDAEVKLIENMGVQFKYNTKIGEDITVKYLENHYDATFMAIGAWESSSMRCEGEKAEGVIGGIDFLRKVTQNEKLKIGNKVIVVGGGNTAMDVARTCVRLGAKEVTVIQLPIRPNKSNRNRRQSNRTTMPENEAWRSRRIRKKKTRTNRRTNRNNRIRHNHSSHRTKRNHGWHKRNQNKQMGNNRSKRRNLPDKHKRNICRRRRSKRTTNSNSGSSRR